MKKLTDEQYHHALALYMLACRGQREVDKMEGQMNDILGDENGSHASDAIYDYKNIGTRTEFDDALRKMCIEMEAKP